MRMKSKLIDLGVEKAGKKFGLSRVKKSLAKIYLKSPSKVQYALAKYKIKNMANKNISKIEELLKN